MYFLDLKALLKQHQEDRFSNRDAFNYIVAIVLTTGIFRVISSAFEGAKNTTSLAFEYKLLVLLFGFACLAIVYFVMAMFYKTNAAGSNAGNFLNRLISLNWVIGFRIFMPITLAYFVLGLFARIEAIAPAVAMLGIVVAAASLLAVIYYIIEMNRGFEILSRSRNSDFHGVPSTKSSRPSQASMADFLQTQMKDRLPELSKIVAEITIQNISQQKKFQLLKQKFAEANFTFNDEQIMSFVDDED